ncbi:Glycoprotein 3-alpha-L-fucosyltransferase A [Schistosoma japonicum]|nr:Glycoprotein 3-alpha-L-fucosyltransferase A [Schistosoma japonicum]
MLLSNIKHNINKIVQFTKNVYTNYKPYASIMIYCIGFYIITLITFNHLRTLQFNEEDLIKVLNVSRTFETFHYFKQCLHLSNSVYHEDNRLNSVKCVKGFKLNISTTKKLIVFGFVKVPLKQSFTECPVSKCNFIEDRRDWRQADLLLITDGLHPAMQRPHNQAWVAFIYEPPYKFTGKPVYKDTINFTANYRLDATIQMPYGYYVPKNAYDNSNTRYPLPENNYAENKTKLIAWLVSNCFSDSPRMLYAKHLSRYI